MIVHYDPAAVDGLLAVLRADIEGLASGRVLRSDYAYTPRRSLHTAIKNGYPTGQEGKMPSSHLIDMAASTLQVAYLLRQEIDGDAVLIWRCLPEFKDGDLYLRLCFEAL